MKLRLLTNLFTGVLYFVIRLGYTSMFMLREVCTAMYVREGCFEKGVL